MTGTRGIILARSAAISLLLLGGWAGAVRAASSQGAGTRSAVFLRDGQGARALAMGGAFTAVGEGVSSLFWNVGGLSAGKGMGVTANHSALANQVKTQSAAFAFSSRKIGGALGVSALQLSAGDIEQRDLSGNVLGDARVGGGAYSPAYGIDLGGTGIGVNLKQIQERLGPDTGRATALDAGLRTEMGNAVTAVSVRNLGSAYRAGGTKNKLSTSVQAGVAYTPETGPLSFLGDTVLAADAEKPADGPLVLHLGGEYRPVASLTLRAGYEQSRRDLEDSGFSAGVGFAFGGRGSAGAGLFGKALSAGFARTELDYAYRMTSSEGLHRISLTLSF